jgi:cytochrome c peroxidase
MKLLSFIVLLTLLLCLSSCTDKKSQLAYQPTPYEFNIPFAFPTLMNIPEDNPMTEEGVLLGRYLFYDGRLSGRTHPDSLMTCATCHIQANNFEAGINHLVFEGGFVHGISGIPTHHVMLPLVNLVWNRSGYGWSGFIYPENEHPSFRNLEDFVWLAVVSEDELDGDTTRVKELFQQIDGYPELFHKAFGSSKVTFKNIQKSIAQFIRTLVSANSRFDRFLRGELQLTQSELNGYVLFTTEEGADCFHCHGGGGNPLFTTHLFYNNGKDTVFDDLSDRFSVTGNPMHKGAYKAPSLRNIALSGPYMHDGRFATLDEVIDFYSHNVKLSPQIDPLMHHVLRGGVQLTTQQKADLKAFILSLQDDEFLSNPEYGHPGHFPDDK